jgi:hypothetical protein
VFRISKPYGLFTDGLSTNRSNLWHLYLDMHGETKDHSVDHTDSVHRTVGGSENPGGWTINTNPIHAFLKEKVILLHLANYGGGDCPPAQVPTALGCVRFLTSFWTQVTSK